MKSKSNLIEEVLNNLSLNEAEALELVKKLIEKYKFSPENCFPKKRGRPKGSLNKKTIAKLEEQKRLENKGKNSKISDTNKETSAVVQSPAVKKKVIGEKKIKKKSEISVRKFDSNLISEKITGFEMGKEYSFYILYKGDDGYIRSKRILENWNAEGVIIPYKVLGKQFVIGLTDECADFTLRQAEEYAKTLPVIKENHWEVMSFEQIGLAKSVDEELNVLLKKLGGDPFIGNYAANGNGNGKGKKNKPKIRYAVDI